MRTHVTSISTRLSSKSNTCGPNGPDLVARLLSTKRFSQYVLQELIMSRRAGLFTPQPKRCHAYLSHMDWLVVPSPTSGFLSLESFLPFGQVGKSISNTVHSWSVSLSMRSHFTLSAVLAVSAKPHNCRTPLSGDCSLDYKENLSPSSVLLIPISFPSQQNRPSSGSHLIHLHTNLLSRSVAQASLPYNHPRQYFTARSSCQT